MDHTGQGDDRRGAVRAALDPGDRGTVQAMSSRSAEAVVSEVLRFETLPLAEGGARRAVVRWSDGTESIPLSWYEDEILITEGDLVGKTRSQIRSLHFQRDRDWLQS